MVWAIPATKTSAGTRSTFVPQFADFNGDGYIDIMVLQRENPTYVDSIGANQEARSMWFGRRYIRHGAIRLCHRPRPTLLEREDESLLKSRVWLQNPDADPSQDDDRWIRDERFDLPNLPEWFLEASLAHARIWMNHEPFLTTPFGLFGSDYPATYSMDMGVRLADLNRDGLTDVIWKWEGLDVVNREGVLINTGAGSAGVEASGWCGSNATLQGLVGGGLCDWAEDYIPTDQSFSIFSPVDQQAFTVGHLGDLNGDRLVDFLYMDGNRELPPGTDVSVAAWLQSPGQADTIWKRDNRFDPFVDSAMPGLVTSGEESTSLSLLDVDGDGVADVVGSNESRASRFHHADLARQRKNGRGGTIQVTYESDILQRDAALEALATAHAEDPEGDGHGPGGEPNGEAEPLGGSDPNAPIIDDRSQWATRPVVSEVKVSGHGFADNVLKYSYADPRWSPRHRSSLGFRLVETQRPDGSSVEHYFWQKHGRAGRTAQVVVRDGGTDVFLEQQDWELPATVPGSLDHPDVFVGRLASIYRANQYGSDPGAETLQTITYDDTYGFNFPSRIDIERPTGDLEIHRLPEPEDTADWLIGLLSEVERRDSSGNQLSRSTFAFTPQGAVSRRNDHVRVRGASPPLEVIETTHFQYDLAGNIAVIIDPSGKESTFCYDGSNPAVSLCESFSGDVPQSRGVLTSVIDGLGNLTTFKPDAASGRIIEIDSDYTDEPTIVRELDPFSRLKSVTLKHVTPPDTEITVTTMERFYGDVAPAFIEEVRYPSDQDSIRTAVVSDGFGGTWKTIEETPSGHRGILTYRHPGDSGSGLSASRRTTYPLVCADALCSMQDGATQTPATTTVLDALGRPVQRTTPDGVSRSAYRSAAGTQPAGPATNGTFDVVLSSNNKGDLVERWMDGDRAVWVRECGNVVDPPGAALPGACTSNEDWTLDETFYAYEPTGELSTVWDAVATASNSYNDPSHYIQFIYDTLGRVREIHDPDGGTSTTLYDGSGNVAATTNARGESTLYAYDDLNRITHITPVSNGEPVTFTYRSNEYQVESESTLSYALTSTYDIWGRQSRQEHSRPGIGGYSLLTDFAYDDLGRVTQIVYPDDETVVNYEYLGDYLDRVCEVGDPGKDCDDPNATFYVSSVEYDGLGRRTKVEMPPGDRTYAYSASTARLTQDNFSSTTSGYAIERNYNVWDEVGNLVSLTGGTTQGSGAIEGDPVVAAIYSYDRRNRIASWERGGQKEHFGYDTLGNLIRYATPGENEINQQFAGTRPHAITSSTASGATISYTHDADGNLATALGGTEDRYYQFDWANRLTGVGTTAAASDVLAVLYDARGDRVHRRPRNAAARLCR